MDESHKCSVWKKPEVEHHIVYNFTYIKFKSLLLHVRIVFTLEGVTLEGGTKEQLLGCFNVLYLNDMFYTWRYYIMTIPALKD